MFNIKNVQKLRRSFIGVVIVLCTAFPFGVAHSAALLGYYSLDGNGVDPTGTGSVLLTPAGAVNYVSGLSGQAASFNGTGSSWLRALINSSGDVNPTFSWGAWVKLSNSNDWNIFLSNDNNGWDRFTQANNGKWSVSNGGGVQNSPYSTSNDWTFIAQTFDGVHQNLYVDSLPVFTATDALHDSQHFIDIGRNANSAYPLKGLMDSVFFFDDVLTSNEIKTIRLGGANGSGVFQVAGITAVPEPDAIWLVSLGLIGFMILMRTSVRDKNQFFLVLKLCLGTRNPTNSCGDIWLE